MMLTATLKVASRSCAVSRPVITLCTTPRYDHKGELPVSLHITFLAPLTHVSKIVREVILMDV